MKQLLLLAGFLVAACGNDDQARTRPPFAVEPHEITLKAETSQRFLAHNAPSTDVTWSAPDGGAITKDGYFEAPEAPGSYRVIASAGNVTAAAHVGVFNSECRYPQRATAENVDIEFLYEKDRLVYIGRELTTTDLPYEVHVNSTYRYDKAGRALGLDVRFEGGFTGWPMSGDTARLEFLWSGDVITAATGDSSSIIVYPRDSGQIASIDVRNVGDDGLLFTSDDKVSVSDRVEERNGNLPTLFSTVIPCTDDADYCGLTTEKYQYSKTESNYYRTFPFSPTWLAPFEVNPGKLDKIERSTYGPDRIGGTADDGSIEIHVSYRCR